MTVFIKSQDKQAWRYILTEWKHPTTTSTRREGEGSSSTTETIMTEKDQEDWSDAELAASQANAAALNAIFAAVDEQRFKYISTCYQAKKAWQILETVHEGTDLVKENKLQSIMSEFEEMRMKEDETVDEFGGRIRDISNAAFQLGKIFDDTALVKKVLRVLPKRFDMKVTAIGETGSSRNMSLDELLGSLKTYEMNVCEHKKREKKDLAFKSRLQTEGDEDDGELSNDKIAFLARDFAKYLKRNGQRGSQERYNPNKFRNQEGSSQNSKLEKSPQIPYSSDAKKSYKIQCRECEEYGHIQAECTNNKKKGKALVLTLSDDEEEEEEYTSNFWLLVH